MVKKRTRNPEREPGVRTKLFIADETIGLGKINLLALVGEVGSISEAARQMGMSYRRAWFLLDSMQSGFAAPLFITERGGAGTGGAQLTPLGDELIQRYRAHVALVHDQSSDILTWMRTVQADPADHPADAPANANKG